MKEIFLVIGGVAAGMSAASRFRRNKPEADVTVIQNREYVSYGSCGLPYFVSGLVKNVQGLVVYDAAFFQQKRNINVLKWHAAIKIDPSAKVVLARDLRGNKEIKLSYDKLAICTGASPTRPELPGNELKNIFAIRSAEDGIALRNFLDKEAPGKAAIIGAGPVGLEMAEALCARGIEVTMVKRPGSILKMFDDDMVAMAEEELERKGVNLVKNALIQGFAGDNKGNVRAVVLADASYEVDFVLLATGANPNSRLAQEAGLKVNANGTIAVNERMQTCTPDVFAAGDCVGQKHLMTGKEVYFPRGTTANKQGRVAGENASGGKAASPAIAATLVSKVFSLTIARTGLSSREAEAESYDFVTSTISHPDHAFTYPDPEPEDITTKLVMERKTGKLLGAQMIGSHKNMGVAKRIDVFATALYNGMTVAAVNELDLSYSPPYSPFYDNILVATEVGLKKLSRRTGE
ncbi:MAG: FAD-dependent oxidoreductase [Dehalococcoidia bacterium]|nr:FAD-dependent oxidoreductase [Dehalococcoidia bacterium]